MAMPMGLGPASANTPPSVDAGPDREADIGESVNLARHLVVNDVDGDPLIPNWDFDASRDANGDGDFTNDNEYKGMTPLTNVTRLWGAAGNYTVTITISDGTDNSTDSFVVRVQAIVGEQAGENILTEKAIGRQHTVAKNGFITSGWHRRIIPS
jgi:hypothetical protein